MRHILSVLVRNHAGVLSHVAGLFTRRSYNIESLVAGETEDPNISRITIVVAGDESVLEQVSKQLRKLVDVISVSDLKFDHAVTMIRELLHSRQLFLRAIMHELKTPIAKGRLVSEMIEDEKSKTRLHSIFERLNLLIDEFAKIEKITSKNFELTIKPYKMSDLLEASEDMLMIENPKRHISTNIQQDYSVDVDFELFTLVIKNLLDNGIKYSTDKHITVDIEDNELTITNNGEALKGPLEDYFKPFHASKKGLGLGLYIVKSILDIHQMELHYHYEDGKNIFTVV